MACINAQALPTKKNIQHTIGYFKYITGTLSSAVCYVKESPFNQNVLSMMSYFACLNE